MERSVAVGTPSGLAQRFVFAKTELCNALHLHLQEKLNPLRFRSFLRPFVGSKRAKMAAIFYEENVFKRLPCISEPVDPVWRRERFARQTAALRASISS